MNKLGNILNKTLQYGLLFSAIALIIFRPDKAYLILICLGGFISSLALEWLLKTNRIGDKFFIPINIAIWLGIFGEIAWFYRGFLYYDKILHIYAGIIISAILYDYYLKNSESKKFLIFFGALGMLGAWEIFEYVIMTCFNYPFMGVVHDGVTIISRLDDTMFDLICGGLGSAVYLFFRKENLDKTIQKEINKIKR